MENRIIVHSLRPLGNFIAKPSSVQREKTGVGIFEGYQTNLATNVKFSVVVNDDVLKGYRSITVPSGFVHIVVADSCNWEWLKLPDSPGLEPFWRFGIIIGVGPKGGLPCESSIAATMPVCSPSFDFRDDL